MFLYFINLFILVIFYYLKIKIILFKLYFYI